MASATYAIDRPYDYLVPPELAEQISPGVRVLVPFSRGNRPTEGLVLALGEAETGKTLKTVSSVLDERPVLSADQLKLALWMRERFFCTVYDAVKAILPAGLWMNISAGYRLADGVDRETAYAAVENSPRQRQALDVLLTHGGSCDYRTFEKAFGETSPQPALRAMEKKGLIVSDSRTDRRVKDRTRKLARLAMTPELALEQAHTRRRTAPMQAAVLSLLASVGQAPVEEITYFTGASPQSIRALERAGALTLEEQPVFRRPEYRQAEPAPLPELNDSQRQCWLRLTGLADGAHPAAALLQGVTGSGKTTVYLHLIHSLLEQGKSVILLVPEIALTPQMLYTFSSHFGREIAVMHSSLTMAERYDEWKRVAQGQARVVIGTRSAVFAPVQNLGAVILDEEQEDTYKSENAPRYHARDVAVYLCARAGALLILGSATPAVESRYWAETGRYTRLLLPERFNSMDLPAVTVVDMKRELRRGNGGSVSEVLRAEIRKNLDAGEQTILFINRRGANKLVTCGDCGYMYQCPNCSAGMTFHSANGRLMCHYCGYSQRVDTACPACGGILRYTGAGTQQVAGELEALFPDTPILRMDRDTVEAAGSHDAVLSRFEREKIPLMVGTQMVTKGLDFPNVTLVGVISADQSLYSGSYRAAEETFSLLTQVVGRSGRGHRPGRAVIQTFTPENPTILQAAAQDYEGFYAGEIALRRAQKTPPFTDLFVLTASGTEENAVLCTIHAIREMLDDAAADWTEARILGPAPLPVVRVRGRYRYHVTVACPGNGRVRKVISQILIRCAREKAFAGVSVWADMNPV